MISLQRGKKAFTEHLPPIQQKNICSQATIQHLHHGQRLMSVKPGSMEDRSALKINKWCTLHCCIVTCGPHLHRSFDENNTIYFVFLKDAKLPGCMTDYPACFCLSAMMHYDS